MCSSDLERSHRDRDGNDVNGRDGDDVNGLNDRAVWLDTTIGGAGRVTGDLTAGCSAALSAVLESLGKRAGLKTSGPPRSAVTTYWRRPVDRLLRLGQPGQVPLTARPAAAGNYRVSLRRAGRAAGAWGVGSDYVR